MGCFVVPVTAAVATGFASTWLHKFVKPITRLAACEGVVGAISMAEHIAHGEVTTTWPFLTGLATAQSRAVLAHELATEGVLLALAGVALWAVWSFVCARASKHRATLRQA